MLSAACTRACGAGRSLSDRTAALLLSAPSSKAASRPFSASARTPAAAKGQQKQTKKKKVVLKKGASSGPRSISNRRKTESPTQASGGLSKSSPFYREPPPPTQYPSLTLSDLTQENVGDIFSIDADVLSALRSSKLISHRGKRGALSIPGSFMLRKYHLSLSDAMHNAITSAAGPESTLLLKGDRGSGKSTSLAMAALLARNQNAAILYIPSALTMVDSSFSFAYSDSNRAYLQNDVASYILSSLVQLNGKLLDGISSEEFAADQPTAQSSTLSSIISQALLPKASGAMRHEALECCLRALCKQTKVPFFIMVDEIEALFTPTLYRDADFQEIQSFQLLVPRLLLTILLETSAASRTGSETQFSIRKGQFIGATTAAQPAFAEIHRLLSDPDRLLECKLGGKFNRLPAEHLTHIEDANFASISCNGVLTTKEVGQLFSTLRDGPRKHLRPNDEVLLAKAVESGTTPSQYLSAYAQALSGVSA